jgi:chemotaxis methyl-accepting protein methylase/PAS domain-containing protein
MTKLPAPGGKAKPGGDSRKRASQRDAPSFPIVGLGASAGGLEALEAFLQHVPDRSNMAFVIVSHLDPTQKGMMVELLQRATTLPVVQVEDRMKVAPNHVYVIPPNKDMSILHGVLHLLAPVARRGLRLPIDFFLRSLADDRGAQAVGVILSGMGTDGTLGLRAIKERTGASFVQALDSAKFDGMPRSAIDAGLADVVAPADQLPERIVGYLRHKPRVTRSASGEGDDARSELDKIVILLRAHTGHDFSLYKTTTIFRRLERRMSIHQISLLPDYVRYLRENPAELDLLFKELLIGVTSFFRDSAAWDQLRDEVLPGLLANRAPRHTLRAWVPGCASGEEAYSLAIVFKETMAQRGAANYRKLQIFATDLDHDAIDQARDGVYPANIAADVSPERLQRYFVEVERGFQIAKSIREMVIFAPQNLVMDPPFTRLDVLSCRNLLIYLERELQEQLVPLFHYCLNPGGVLFLGSAETVGRFTDLFTPLAGASRLYQRIDAVHRNGQIEFPSAFVPARDETRELQDHVPPASDSGANLQVLAEQLLLRRQTPAWVLVNATGDILNLSGHTGKYLEPAAGKANWNIFAMARDGLRSELSGAFHRAVHDRTEVTVSDIAVATNGGAQHVGLTVQPLDEPEGLRGLVMVVFADQEGSRAIAEDTGTRQRARSGRVAELERRLQAAHQELSTLREAMRATEERLHAANEELQSTNEELQSTNEELTTSKEELQSLNEELQTVNQELLAKLDELSLASDDMKNLLDSTNIATIFLDTELRVRRFTAEAASLSHLIPGDVGRPLTDLSSDLVYPDLPSDVRQVLDTLVRVEKEVPMSDGRWFAARVLPYRAADRVIDGVVVTLTDVTRAKRLEAELRQTQAELTRRVGEQAVALDETEKQLVSERRRRPEEDSDES